DLLPAEQTNRLIRLINDYRLPVTMTSDKEAVFSIFKLDKKREKDHIHFVLLEKLGLARTQPILLDELKQLLEDI
ncbi:MAG: 3-dehydroquinate synthase, partial [Chitinophaga sp.]